MLLDNLVQTLQEEINKQILPISNLTIKTILKDSYDREFTDLELMAIKYHYVFLSLSINKTADSPFTEFNYNYNFYFGSQ